MLLAPSCEPEESNDSMARPKPAHSSIQNGLLAKLSRADYARLVRHLEPIDFSRGDVVYEAQQADAACESSRSDFTLTTAHAATTTGDDQVGVPIGVLTQRAPRVPEGIQALVTVVADGPDEEDARAAFGYSQLRLSCSALPRRRWSNCAVATWIYRMDAVRVDSEALDHVPARAL